MVRHADGSAEEAYCEFPTMSAFRRSCVFLSVCADNVLVALGHTLALNT